MEENNFFRWDAVDGSVELDSGYVKGDPCITSVYCTVVPSLSSCLSARCMPVIYKIMIIWGSLHITCAFGSQGENLGLPGGELCDISLYLFSDILKALGDGRLVVCIAETHGRHEELLHAGHLSHYCSQTFEG